VFPGRLNLLIARERIFELHRAADQQRRHADPARTPVTRVTLRYSSAADRESLRALAQLDSSGPPSGTTLVAEVDGRLRAALPLDGSRAIADPFHRGLDLVELLRLRAAQLADG
jgi:hypothetical protein